MVASNTSSRALAVVLSIALSCMAIPGAALAFAADASEGDALRENMADASVDGGSEDATVPDEGGVEDSAAPSEEDGSEEGLLQDEGEVGESTEGAAEGSVPEEEAMVVSENEDGEEAEGGPLELAGITVWGVHGDTVTSDDFEVSGNVLTVRTDKHFAVGIPDQTQMALPADWHASSFAMTRHANPVSARMVIPSGQTANILLSGIGLYEENALDVQSGAVCHLVLADGTHNSFYAHGNNPAIHNPTGATVTIDDEVANRDGAGNLITPKDGLVPYDATLANGRVVRKGDPLSVMDSADPGSLLALITGVGNSSAFGGWSGQVGGSVTINGGVVAAYNAGSPGGSSNCGAALGGGSGAGGTSINEWITINGGRVDADSYKTWYGHGAAIGGGNAAYTGNIRINGGFTISTGGSHGSGFGAGCLCPSSNGYQIIITGGTLIPSSVEHPFGGCGDIGAPGVDITITGGSVGNGRPGKPFNFVGSAHDANGNELCMVEVDLTGDVGENTYALADWELLVGGTCYDYGTPAEFDRGHLYLWLPRNVVAENEVGVNFKYRDGTGGLVEPTTLFRPAGDPAVGGDSKLRRYVDFDLPAWYTEGLKKYYDGMPFDGYSLEEHPIHTAETPAKVLDSDANIEFKYQRYDAIGGNPLGAEITSDADGNPLTELSPDAGIVKFTLTSKQYSDNSDPQYAAFKESYWGHRATGWYEIKPIESVVRDLKVEWANGDEGAVEHSADDTVVVSAVIDRSPANPDGTPSAGTCKAPRGSVQLFVDDEAVGVPIGLAFDEAAAYSSRMRMARTASAANATAVDNGQGGSYTQFTYAFAPSEADALVPVAKGDHAHTVSLQYIPSQASDQGQESQAAYLESASPADPGASGVEQGVVAIEPVDPAVDVQHEDVGSAPPSSVDTGAGEPSGPSGSASDTVFKGSISTGYGQATEDNPNPGRVVMKIESLSSGELVVTQAGPLEGADFVRDADGNPVRDENGFYTLVADPARAGSGTLEFTQKPNGAFTGTTWVYDVTVDPDHNIAPYPGITMVAENLTNPGHAAQPGDIIEYRVVLDNAADGSVWRDVVLSDVIPSCMEFIDGTACIKEGAGDDFALEEAAAGAEPKAGQYALVEKDGAQTFSACIGEVWGGLPTTLSFQCKVAADAAGRGVGASVGNGASAEGVRTDPDDPRGDMLAVDPVTSDVVHPGAVPDVIGADPDLKVLAEVDSSSGGVVRPGDRVSYKTTVSNDGPPSSCIYSAVIVDPLPEGLVPDVNAMYLASPSGQIVKVPPDAFDPETRTVSVHCGDIWGGEQAVLSLSCIAQDGAGGNLENTVYVLGDIPSRMEGAPASEPLAGSAYAAAGGEAPVASGKATTLTLVPGGSGVDGEAAGPDGALLPGADFLRQEAIPQRELVGLAQTGDDTPVSILAFAALMSLSVCLGAASAFCLRSSRRSGSGNR